MIKEAIEKIVAMAPVEKFTFFDQPFTSKMLHEVRPHKQPKQKALTFRTLTGISDWLKSADGEEARKNCIIHIEDFNRVSVFSSPDTDYRLRHEFINAISPTDIFNFGCWHKIEDFVINASSKFVMTDELKALFKVVSNIKQIEVVNVEDDGISQKVTTSGELNRVAQVKISPFQNLKPHRTFSEVDQPESRFLLRIKQQKDALPKVALFEADNARWKIHAMENIRDFIQGKIDDCEGNINIVM